MLSTFPRAFQITGQLQEYYSSLKSNSTNKNRPLADGEFLGCTDSLHQVSTLNLNQ